VVGFGTGWSAQSSVRRDDQWHRLYVASTSNSAVESSISPAHRRTAGRPALPPRMEMTFGSPSGGLPISPTRPGDHQPARTGGAPYAYPLQPPHMLDYPNTCARCHSMDGLPAGGMLRRGGPGEPVYLRVTPLPAARWTPCFSAGTSTCPIRGAWLPRTRPRCPEPAAGCELALHLDNGSVRLRHMPQPAMRAPTTANNEAPIRALLATHPWPVTHRDCPSICVGSNHRGQCAASVTGNR